MDHPDVWIPVYQPSCPWSDFSRRTQSTDPHVATTALRRFAFYFGRSKAPEIEVNLTLQERLLTALMHAQGQSKLAEDTIHEHRRLHPEEAEEVADAVQQTVRANGQEFGIEGVIPPQPEMYGDD